MKRLLGFIFWVAPVIARADAPAVQLDRSQLRDAERARKEGIGLMIAGGLLTAAATTLAATWTYRVDQDGSCVFATPGSSCSASPYGWAALGIAIAGVPTLVTGITISLKASDRLRHNRF